MHAVHFGAGNIGRGFIGVLLHQSGYEVSFVDINQELIEAINQRKGYKVVHAAHAQEEIAVSGVHGINSEKDPDKVVEAIAQANLVTTAVGPHVLKFISDLVAKGIRMRMSQSDKALTIIACENMIGGSTLLKESVYEKLTEKERIDADKLVSFPNSAVDRIVPDQRHDEVLKVMVEPFYEWIVEHNQLQSIKPPVKGITYVADLFPYIERKLFTVNTGHAVAAYLGYYYQFSTIREAMEHQEIRRVVEGALYETGAMLIDKYGFDEEEHFQYIQKILQRFENPYITDEVTRIARSPIRKLGENDRFISPAKQFVEQFKKPPIYLIIGIAAALLYDYTGEPDVAAIHESISNVGLKKAIETYTGLTGDHLLVEPIIQKYQELKKAYQSHVGGTINGKNV